jgi:phosphopantetheine--protein transferase-like protein
MARWAEERGLSDRHLHVSNSHDGNAHLVFAAYDPALVGVGVDVVYLPRLRRAGRDAAYLQRFAERFMSEEERDAFERQAAREGEEALRLRVAAHFSLMEAASKACGTGLKLGVGMGRATSLPPQALGVRALEPEVEFTFGPEAEERLRALGATHSAGYWSADAEYLISVVLLFADPAW